MTQYSSTAQHNDASPVLLINAELDALFLLERAAQSQSVPRDVHVAPDPRLAMGQLRRAIAVGERTPGLILVDLCAAGLELIGWIRRQPELGMARIVAVFRPSEALLVDAAYRLGVDGCMDTPRTSDDFTRAFALLDRAWLEAA